MTTARSMRLHVEDPIVQWLEDTVPAFAFDLPLGGPPQAGVKLYFGCVDEDRGATLYWTDYVANDWTEWYEDVSTALARLACLARCQETNWDAFFIGEPGDFVKHAEAMFLTSLTGNPKPGRRL